MDYSLGRSGLFTAANKILKSAGWGQLVNADVDSSAAIALSKLAATTAGLVRSNGTVVAGGATVVNTDVDAAAAIALSKLAALTKGEVMMGGASANFSSPISRRNRIINGDMVISQRRALVSSTTAVDNTYQTVDRWRSIVDTTAGSSPGVFQDNTQIPSTLSSNREVILQSAGGTGKFGIFQVLESSDCYDLRGGVVSLQFKANASVSISDVRAAVLQWTGTADAVSADPVTTWGASGSGVTTYSGSWAQANTPANLGVVNTHTTIKVENISISASATNIAVMIWNDDTTTTNGEFLAITDVQLEKGAVCTEYERTPFATTLALCQRYYWKTFGLDVTPIQNAGTTLGASPGEANCLACISINGGSSSSYNTKMLMTFPVRMRTTPTIVFYNVWAANTNFGNLSSDTDSSITTGLSVSSENGFEVYGTSGTTSAGNIMGVHATASAEL